MNTVPISVLALALLLLILMSGFFSGSETALMSLNRYRLRHRAHQGDRAALRTSRLLEKPERLIGLILLGNNFVNILASAIATVIALRVMGEAGIAVATGLLTLIVLVFAEVTPKTFATRRAEQVADIASAVYVPLLKVIWPVVWVVNWITQSILDLLNVSAETPEDHLSSEELRTVLNETAGLIPARHREMLLNILDLSDVSVDDIMVPRSDIVGLDLDDSWEDILETVRNSPHSRLLAYREDIDNVVGFLNLRRIIDVLHGGRFTRTQLEAAIQECYFIPESTRLTVQLLNFQREKRRIGLVVDEYGDIIGLLTIEDILEEIVGEFDVDPHAQPAEIQPQGDGSFIVNGATPIRNINKTLKWSLPLDGPRTLNGVVLEHFENFPESGASFELLDSIVTVLDVEENQVRNVRIDPAPQKDSDD